MLLYIECRKADRAIKNLFLKISAFPRDLLITNKNKKYVTCNRDNPTKTRTSFPERYRQNPGGQK